MAKKKRTKVTQEKSDNSNNLLLGSIEYSIERLSFEYSFTQNPVFQACVNVKIPDVYLTYPINLNLPIDLLLSLVAKENEAMSKYVQKVIDSFDDPQTCEKLAFDALAEEGFDLERLVRLAFEWVSIDPTQNPDETPDKPRIKIFSLKEVGFDVQEINLCYSDSNPRICFFNVMVKVPKHVFQDTMIIDIELDKGLSIVERYNVDMAKYFRKSLAAHADEPNSEILTIQTLAEEGFDFNQFVVYALSDYQMKIEQKVSYDN